LEDYSLSLALFDYIPVGLSALGLFMLATLIGQAGARSRPVCLLGALLIACGGLSKASWKLTWVLSGQDITPLSNLLFILMAPGFIILACHGFFARRYWLQGLPIPHRQANASAMLLIGLTVAATTFVLSQDREGRGWFFLLLATASLANIFLSANLIQLSWRLRQRGTALIFAFSITIIVCLGGLSRFSEGSAPLQWLAECLNVLAHGSFALAVWRLRPVILSRNTHVSTL
jgi:hypothetical protein